MQNLKSQCFTIKEIYVYFYEDMHLPVQVAAAKFRLVMKISDLSIKISHQIYMLHIFLYFNKVHCICGMLVVYFSKHQLMTSHVFI